MSSSLAPLPNGSPAPRKRSSSAPPHRTPSSRAAAAAAADALSPLSSSSSSSPPAAVVEGRAVLAGFRAVIDPRRGTPERESRLHAAEVCALDRRDM